MTREPTGRLFGKDLVLTRSFRAPIDDVWASVTEPERTARWFGSWKGTPGPGRTIQVQMSFEPSSPWMDMTIDACEPPTRLALSSVDDHGSWHMELLLSSPSASQTELRFVQHLTSLDGLGEVGPGWEYYLDQLVASRDDTPLPSFDDYYPSMQSHYESLRGA
ncbi:SRPBCC family protein [Dactylosporangium sucinum]|uniref:Activator of Hsp90 ATPase homologue 1/2-like C-terminal domain-containing protein n=1 Tax=Dactylosporangium sucinum TaxID=1424081 RepID=A0A917UC65_9ACTN|nr:SRPBCC family protein [Dactylosporangium sucinum]GGM80227.1 hypothetical protein GCM10007977_097170 [Dactylosporangium sucinum]